MRRNLLLVLAIIVSVLLIASSARRIVSFRDTSQRVTGEEERLLELKKQNEQLKIELEYKKSQRFAEEEIRNKLGMAREGEEVFVVPVESAEENDTAQENRVLPNWKKWQKLIFGEG